MDKFDFFSVFYSTLTPVFITQVACIIWSFKTFLYNYMNLCMGGYFFLSPAAEKLYEIKSLVVRLAAVQSAYPSV